MAGAVRLAADAVVIGTGAGGAPVAATLAEAGIDTLVLEAGPRIGTEDFTGEEGEMMARLYRLDVAPGSGMALYAGECVGGSTVINDALCFRPPPEILDEWVDAYGLGALAAASLAPFVEQAWRDVHAEPTDRAHTSRNAARLVAGAERLGWSGSATPRNVIGCANLGLCNLGCPTGAKQSTLLTYVPRAERAGARVLGRTRAERIVIEGGRVRAVDVVTAGREAVPRERQSGSEGAHDGEAEEQRVQPPALPPPGSQRPYQHEVALLPIGPVPAAGPTAQAFGEGGRRAPVPRRHDRIGELPAPEPDHPPGVERVRQALHCPS